MKNAKHQEDTTVSFRIGVEKLQGVDNYCNEIDLTRSQLLRKLISSFKPVQKTSETARAISGNR